MQQILAQLADYGPLVSQLGFGGLLTWIVSVRLDRLEHTLKGLSKALWLDLAERSGPGFIRDEAKKTVAKMEQADRADR